MEYTIEIKEFGDIVIKKPTIDQFLKISDKRTLYYLGTRPVADQEDDGDEEIINLIVSPDETTIRKWYKKIPLLLNNVWQILRDECGDECKIKKIENQLYIDKYGSDLFGLEIDEKPFAFRRPHRSRIKLILRDMVQTGVLLDSVASKIAREYIIPEQKEEAFVLFNEKPASSVRCGYQLYNDGKFPEENFIKKA